jgi:ligand-binding sensor domain-containing protein
MMFSDAEKNLWITHNTLGVIRLGYDKKFQNFSQANGISSSLISYVFRDRESNLWFANEEKGVDKLTSERIEIYPADPKYPKTYINGTSTGDTVLLLDRKNNCISMIAGGHEKTISLPEDWSPTIVAMRKDRLYAWNWLTLYTASLDKNDRLIRIRKYNIQRPEKFGLYNGTFDREGNLLLTCNTKLIVFTVEGQFQYYQLDDFTDKAIIDLNGRIWVITRTDNLYVFERSGAKSSDSLHLLKLFRKEMEGGFRTITCDRMNRLWIGTRNKGVWCIQVDKHLNILYKKQFSVKDGLTNNFALDIQSDSANNLWISSPSGLDRLSWNDEKTIVENVTRANNIFQYVAKSVINQNGEIICLTSTGNILKIKRASAFQLTLNPGY